MTCAHNLAPESVPGDILVLNAGSSSIKCALFDAHLIELLRIEASGVGGPGALRVGAAPATDLALPDHAAALNAVARALERSGAVLSDLACVAHRVVHGGAKLTAPSCITPQVRADIAECVPLAPLHNPHHLAAIDWVHATYPKLPQVACFDTAFHATQSPLTRRYALPETSDTQGLQRYGFHGNSYAALVEALPQQTGGPLPDRLLALHLGNGASLCAIRSGKSVATTMGFAPLGGLTMGTRIGEIDPGAVLELVRRMGLDAAEALLTQRSGLLGLSGLSADMRTLSQSDSPNAAFARAHFAKSIILAAGQMIAAMEGLDAIAFTGGIGEHDAQIRAEITAGLAWAGEVPAHIVPAAEEYHIARAAFRTLEETS